ncbi:MAG TPA: TonB-dependent receptor, partial [Bacteroidales bacterium]|nr:TonB-dependent receptor [Bacteroidales bacterium]
ANFNISFNKSRIDDLGDVNSFLQSSEWNSDVGADYLVEVGQPVGIIWGFATDGFYAVDDFNYDPVTGEYTLKEGVPDNSSITFAGFGPGALKFKNLADPVDEDGVPVPDGNQVTFDADRTIIGNANPKHIGGFNLSMYYKHFDASIFLNWVYGNDIYNANKIEFTSEYRKYTNMLGVMSMDDRWRTIDENGVVVTDPDQLAALNASATIWAPPQGRYLLHSWAIEDGSFLRINNVTVGYSLPEKFLRKTFIKSLRIYATGNNLFTFTKYSGYDPEVNTRTSTFLTPGVDYSAYPRSRMYLAGLNVKF